MAKKSAPIDDAPESDPQNLNPSTPESLPLEVPQDVIDAMGGRPIPPPPIRPDRPTVTRVGEPLAKGRPDPGGLLATPRPERRAAIKKIDAARASISGLVRKIEEGLAVTGALIGEAIEDIEACEAEGFDPVRASALIEELAAALSRSFTAES